MAKIIFFLCFNFIACGYIFAQDTLPGISVKSRSGKVIISWVNAYGAKISNINIQRSNDSLKRFTTIGTVLNPLNKENGFVDAKPWEGNIYYRVFVAFDGGNYFFTKSYQPSIDTLVSAIIEKIEEKAEPIKPSLPHAFVPSKFVFTGKDNNVIISLPNASLYKYSITFFDDADKLLFEIKNIKEPYLILEKVNFLHAGWFKYHLFNNGILLEKYKFNIVKEGRSSNNNR